MSLAGARASVLVRTFNSAATLTACLESLRSQTVTPEIIVVDSGSTDGTLAIANRMADRIVHVPDRPFSYGRALNRGAAVATAPVHFALSSHCSIPGRDWIERSLRHYENPDVAATNGQQTLPDGSPLEHVFYLRGDTDLPNPFWGFSNHASSWRADIWRDEPFNESLVASEDFEWSDRVRALGFAIVFDPALTIPGDHRTAQGPVALYRRSYREFLGTAACRRIEPSTLRRSLMEWWSEHPPDTKPHRQRLSPYRIAVIAARYMAGRSLHSSAVDVMYVVSGTTQGHQRADRALMSALGKVGVNAVMVTGDFSLPWPIKRQVWRSMLTIDLFQAMVLRGAARRGVKRHRPRAILYATSHAAMLQPRRSHGRVGIRFDTPARVSRKGRLFAVEHWLERRQFNRARVLAPWGLTVHPSIAGTLPRGGTVVPLPIPVAPISDPNASERLPIVVAYAGNAHKKGLDRVVSAWAQVPPGGRRLLITGVDRAEAVWYLREQGIAEPPGIEWRGKLSPSDHRTLTSRAEIYLAASRYEDYGVAQLEALADGSVLVTTPSPGPFVALPIARELDSRLVADSESAEDLARALRTALEMTDAERDAYRRRADGLLRPFSPACLEQRLRDEVLPALLSESP